VSDVKALTQGILCADFHYAAVTYRVGGASEGDEIKAEQCRGKGLGFS
jgi:hypothetical protein